MNAHAKTKAQRMDAESRRDDCIHVGSRPSGTAMGSCASGPTVETVGYAQPSLCDEDRDVRSHHFLPD